MCIAIFKPEGKILSNETLLQCWDSNPDGAGFMYADGGEVKIKKGYMDFDSFIAAYEQHKQDKMVIHFRIKTHGLVNEENTHPFRVNKKMGFVHNGTISGVHTKDKAYSDTWHFNEQIIKPIVKKAPWMMDTAAIQTLITDFIGYSKLIFMDGRGDVTIYNESKGYWDDECWFSNKSYEPKKTYTPPATTYYGGYSKGAVEEKVKKDTTPMPHMGDVVFTIMGYGDIPKDSYGSVIGFGENPFVWVSFTNNGVGTRKVPAYAIQKSRVYEKLPDYSGKSNDDIYDDAGDLLYQLNDLVSVTKKYGQADVDDVGIVTQVHRRACTVELYNGARLIIPNRFLDLTWGN